MYAPAPFDASAKTGWLAKEFKRLDRNEDGMLLLRDLELPEGLVRGADADGDGALSFDELAIDQVKKIGGYVGKFGETAALFTKQEKLRSAEWPGDNPLFRRIDEDKDGVVLQIEFDRYVRALRTALALASDFAVRFDLDGDGKVARAEFPGSDAVFARLDPDGDGFVARRKR
jgi:hypothetical protein